MDKNAYKNIWVFIEVTRGKIQSASIELCCEGRKLADASGEKLAAIVLTDTVTDEMRTELERTGIDQLICVTGSEYAVYTTDVYTATLEQLCKKYQPSAFLFGATANGRDLTPRLAGRLHTGSTADATEIAYNPETGNIDWTKPSFGGNLMATIICAEARPQLGSIRPGTFQRDYAGVKPELEVILEEIAIPARTARTEVLEFIPEVDEDGVKVEEASVVICLGGGLKSMEQAAPFQELADLLGGVIGVTRPLIDNGFYPFKRQVGQSGKSISPKLYIGFGISGAIQHTVGITSSDVIVAVNSDPEAPIFGYADYGIVGDMNEVCEAMVREIKALRKG